MQSIFDMTSNTLKGKLLIIYEAIIVIIMTR